MTSLPETILQFGAGNFLRAFADWFIHHANVEGQGVGRVVIVQSTAGSRADWLNESKGRYNVVIRGKWQGAEVDRVDVVESVSRALVAADQWEQVLEFAASDDLEYILSNTTEAGFEISDEDGPDAKVPVSFPARLLHVLRHRFEAGKSAPTLIPCELRDDNADLLRKILVDMAKDWSLKPEFISWLEEDCRWWNTLVDRIVTGRPDEHELRDTDPLLTVGEPFALWAIGTKGAPFIDHPLVRLVDDVQPYALRKVRILNGAHSALVIRTRDTGIETVREAVLDKNIRPWLESLLFEEILPTVKDRIVDGEDFVRQTLERFENPFVEHKFSSIALHHDTKVKVRLEPTRTEYIEAFGKKPPILTEILG